MTEQTTAVPAPVVASASALPVLQPADAPVVEDSEDSLIEADLLVEDVSIDGMCGVY